MIFVLTGKGKGKTTSSLGMGLRAVGAGKSVLMVQFLKTGDSSEISALKKLAKFKTKSFGRKGFAPYNEKDKELAAKGMEFLRKEIGKYDLVILDEINMAMFFKLVKAGEVKDVLDKYGKKKDIVLTGRNCPKDVIKLADLVTDLRELKHYFKKGVRARKGIEY